MLATIPLTVFGSYSDPFLWRTFIINLHIEEQVNSNTNRETKSDMKMLNAFMLEVLKDNRDICQIPDNELNTIICKFIINVRQRNGSEYEPNTVKGIVASIDRHIRSNN
jgi:hypothetical protein